MLNLKTRLVIWQIQLCQTEVQLTKIDLKFMLAFNKKRQKTTNNEGLKNHVQTAQPNELNRCASFEIHF